MADDGSVEGATWPMPKFRFDTHREAEKAGWRIGDKHIVTEGDSLKTLSQRLYGDQRYYGRIAHYNNLNKFRNLKGGQNLIFPPLVK